MSMTDWYVVAVVMTRNTGQGSLTIVSRMDAVPARSPDEAKGTAIGLAMQANPDHQVFNVMVCKTLGVEV